MCYTPVLGAFLGRSQATRSLEKFLRTLFNSAVHAVPAFGYFSHRRDKMPGHSDFRMKGFASAHNLRVRSIVTGKSRQWEHKAVGHIVSAVTERETNAVFSSLSPFSAVQDPSPWNSAAHM